MDSKELKINWRQSMRKWKYLLLIIICVSILIVVTIFALIAVDQRNTERYRRENYARFQGNIDAFAEAIANTDGYCDNMQASVFALPDFIKASYDELMEQQLPSEKIVGETQIPYQHNTTGYKLYARMQTMLLTDMTLADIALYNKNSGTAIAVTNNGHNGALFQDAQSLSKSLGINNSLLDAKDKAILSATPSSFSKSNLYILRHLEGDIFLLCGMEDGFWRHTLLYDNCGRSYQLEQIAWRPDGGQLWYGNQEKTFEQIGYSLSDFHAENSVQILGKYTLMHWRVEDPGYDLYAVMTETGATGVASSELFRWLVILDVLWLLIIAAICGYVLVCIYRPIHEITNKLPFKINDEGADSIAKISQAINVYDQQLTNNRLTINEKIDQLRRACLKLLVMDQVPSITPTQMQELGIPALLERFVLVMIYPNDGHWTQVDGSAQELSYRSHVTMTTIQQLLKPHITDAQVEFLLFEECLLLIIPVTENIQEHELRSRAENWVMHISVHLNKKFLFGISKVRCGQENFSRAYHDAMRRAALVEERESGRSEDITLNMLLKQNMQMADLVYMERYADAFSCMKEMIETLSKQKSRHLRNQQLSSLLSITYCMLTETNPENIALLEQMNLDINELIKVESESEALQKWEIVFTELENHKDARLHGQFSDEFASIYQYLYAHYKDPDISLSLLAEQFDMSLSTLSREFQKNTGLGFLECLHRMRVDAAKYEIEHSSTSLSEIAEAVGYTNTLTMTRAFKKYLGATPSTFRKKDAP